MIKRILSVFLLAIALLFPNISGATIKWANNATSLIADSGGISAGATEVTVTTGEGDKFPDTDAVHFFMITFVDVSANREIVKVIARAPGSNTMTIERAQEGTSARAFAEGSLVDLRITAGSLDEFSHVVDLHANVYFCDASATDQADTVNDNSLASLVDDIGTTLNATIILPHSGTGSTTPYYILQAFDLSAYDNITFIIRRGAIITHGASTLSIQNFGDPDYKIFAGIGAITLMQEHPRPEWWGAERDGTTDDDVPIQAAIDTASNSNTGVLLSAGNYLFNTKLDIPVDGKIIGAGINKTTLTRMTGGAGIAIYSDGDADGIALEGFLLDCDFEGTNGIDLGNSGSGAWGERGRMSDVRVIDCAGIAYNLNVDGAYGYNISTDNDSAGSPGAQQILIAGDVFNCYGLEITGEAGTTAGLEFTGDNCNIFSLTMSGELHLTKHIRFNGGDNNVITGFNIVTEDNTKTYTQLVYFESGSQENSIRDVEIEKGATDTITSSVEDAENTNTIAFATDFQEYNQTYKAGFFKAGLFTRDISLATGTQAVTGVGFKPKAVIFFSVVPGTNLASWGQDDGTTSQSLFDAHGIGADQFGGDDTNAISVAVDTGNRYFGDLLSFDDDGFTVNWVKTGFPTGTLKVYYLALR
jgi:hypothetical protein